MASRYYDIHVRLNEEEHDFLKKSGINQSKLVHDAIKEEMEKLPDNLKKRKEICEREIEQINRSLEKLSEKKVIAEKYVDKVIVHEFLKFGRIDCTDEQNIGWLKNRYDSELEKRDIAMSFEELLHYCKRAWEERRNASR